MSIAINLMLHQDQEEVLKAIHEALEIVSSDMTKSLGKLDYSPEDYTIILETIEDDLKGIQGVK